MAPIAVLNSASSLTILKKIATLEKEIDTLKESVQHTISYTEAKQLVVSTLEQWKKEGVREADVIRLHAATHLPLLQINEIMEELEKEGKICGEKFDF